MKTILFIPIICTLLFGKLQAQEGISLTKVEEIYTLSEINYTGEKTITLKLNSGLIIKVTPVNPPELDELFYEKSLANGQLQYKDYDQSKNDYFIKKKKKRQKAEKTNTEMLMELAEILLENSKITEEQYNKVKLSVENRKTEAEPEIESNIPIAINPFYLNKKYLSVYQLTIENLTAKPIIFDEEINLLFGGKLYSRYSTQEVLDLYKIENINNFSKISLLINENLSENILVPAGVTFSKYICTEPIKYEAGKLSLIISSSTNSATANWDIDISTNEIEKTYTYNVFDFYITSNTGLDFSNMSDDDGVLISFTDNVDFHLLGQKLYVNQDDLEKPIDFIALFIYLDNAYFTFTQVVPQTYLDINKKRTEDIEIETIRTEKVKRKLD
ncbi:MAG: hypothetical protein IPI31_13980 [Bacteroidetes bacterium]|jgi:hypothetical protein|nr:hypothetical protein [Bacteroidota bacterium]